MRRARWVAPFSTGVLVGVAGLSAVLEAAGWSQRDFEFLFWSGLVVIGLAVGMVVATLFRRVDDDPVPAMSVPAGVPGPVPARLETTTRDIPVPDGIARSLSVRRGVPR